MNKESFLEHYEFSAYINHKQTPFHWIAKIQSCQFGVVWIKIYFLDRGKIHTKIYIHRKIVLPVCFDIKSMIFYYQLQKFSISLCTNSVVIYREKKFSLTVLSQLYTKKREKVFFNFILKQHWIPIAVWWSLNDSVITHTITIRSNVQHLRWSDVMTL